MDNTNNKNNSISRRDFMKVSGGVLAAITGLAGQNANAQILTKDSRSNSKLNIILVAMDQLRADHVHSYGYFRNTSPSLDRMAAEGTLFTRMYASASWTTPSYHSVLTSLHPSRHRMTLYQAAGAPILDSSIPLLAEQFKKAEYKTVAFVNNANAGKRMLGRGFDEFYEREDVAPNITERIVSEKGMRSSSAPATNEKIYSWLQNQSEPFFMFILYFEPHSPYDPPVEHDIFKTDAYPNETHTGYDPQTGRLLRWANSIDNKAIERLNALYDGKIHFVDHYFGQLLDRLKKMGLDQNTVVVFFSDHGELLYEYDDVLTFDHRSLYDANIHVPFIIKGPGIPKGKTVGAMTSHIDIAPTILEIAGLPQMPGSQGKNLLPVIKGEKKIVHDYVFSEQDISQMLRSVRDKQYKLIYNTQTGKKQLYDTIIDPRERNDISSQNPQIVVRLFKVLEEYMAKNTLPEQEKLKLWQETIEAGPKEIVIDEVTYGDRLQLVGNGWRMADHSDNYLGACYWVQPSAYGSNIAIWHGDNPFIGEYEIFVRYGQLPGVKAASNAKYTVVTDLRKKTFVVNQNERQGEWVLLGKFTNPISVKLTNSANGPVIVDAVKFVRI